MKKFRKTVTPSPRTAFLKSLFRPKKRVNATYFVSRQKRVFILLHLLQVIFVQLQPSILLFCTPMLSVQAQNMAF